MFRNEIVLFADGETSIEVTVTPDADTVWLTQDQMINLFDTARSSIAYRTANIFKEGEPDRDTSVEIFGRSTKASRPPMY